MHFLDRKWDPRTKILTLLFSAFALPISYFYIEKKIQKDPKSNNIFSPQNRLMLVSKFPEFYADFRFKKTVNKKSPKKIIAKNCSYKN